MEEWGIKMGDFQWRLVKFLEMSGGCYIIPCVGHTGLHLSIHPSNQEFAYPHIHFKSDRLGIHEDVEFDDRFFSPECWQNKVERIISSFEVGCDIKSCDNQVLVFPNLNQLVSETPTQHYFNLYSILDGEFYMTEEKKVPSLAKKIKCDPLIGFTERNQMLFVDKECQIRFCPQKIFQTLLGSNNLFSNSFETAFHKVICQLKDKIPINSQKIIPKNAIQMFESLKNRRPKIKLIHY